MRISRWKSLSAFLLCIVLITYLVSDSKNSVKKETIVNTDKVAYFEEERNAFGNITAPSDFDWRQCDGTVLNFLLEDNINANILSKEVEKFTNATGIEVNIKCVDFNTLVEKINMDFISKTAQYDLIYVDPYQTLDRFSDSLEDLYTYENNENLPHIVGGLESFQKEHTYICSFFKNNEKLCAIPFDSTSMILFYRKDIFKKYGEEMKKDLGYVPQPGSVSFTWENYLETAEWISKNVPKSEIKYSSLNMSAKHNSIYTEFSNFLCAYGGSFFKEENAHLYGVEAEKDIQTDTKEFRKALSVYKEYADLEPSEAGFNWTQVTEAFKKGDVAMMINWDENAAAIESKKDSAVAGKVGYGILPFGDTRSACIYGGSGIGINSYAGEHEKLAAWMFIVWATSPQVQLAAFLGEEGGNLPTRTSLIRLIEAKYMFQLPQSSAAIRSLKKNYAYYRPKMGKNYEFEEILVNHLFRMVHSNVDEETTAQNIKSDWEKIIKEMEED